MIYDCKLAIVNLDSRTTDGILMINLIFLPSKLHVPTLSTKLFGFFLYQRDTNRSIYGKHRYK